MAAFSRDRLSPLTLGTVQLGMPYGVANAQAVPGPAEAEAVFDAAWAGGIACFDTARAYGEAEPRLGRWLARRTSRPLVISKFPPLGDVSAREAVAALDSHLAASLAALGLPALDGWLAHRAADILRPEVGDRLRALVDAGRIGAFGTSAYTPEEVHEALAVPGLGLVQAPLSLFDRRLVRSGALDACRRAGVAVFARSVFLQGAIFLDRAGLPGHLRPLAVPLQGLDALAAQTGRSRAALALGYVRAIPGVASVVIGALTADQLRHDMAAAPLDPTLMDTLSALGDGLPDAILDPRRWPR